MKHKILKKILGILDYKLIDKNYFKNNRIITNTSDLNEKKIIYHEKKKYKSYKTKVSITT